MAFHRPKNMPWKSSSFYHLVSITGCSQKNEEKVLLLGRVRESPRSEGMLVKLMVTFSLEADILADISLFPVTAVSPQIESP